MRLLLLLCLFVLLSGCDTTAQPSEPIHYSEVAVRPVPIEGFEAFSASVEYPELARRAGIGGTVIIHFTANEDGSVVSTYDSDVRRGPVCVSDPGGNTCQNSLIPLRAALLTPAYVRGEKVSVNECFAFEYEIMEGPAGRQTNIRVSHCP
ncbi:MAG: energy transducer TonB [Rhodothermales bacterium]